MKHNQRAGLTLWEVLAVILVLGVLYLALVHLQSAIGSAKPHGIMEKGRSIWVAVVSANSEREPLGLVPLWPKELGFGFTNRSTEYFRRLMSDSNGVIAASAATQSVGDLTPGVLSGGGGVPAAASAQTFGSANNAWNVLCVSNDTPAECAFLVTCNAELGSHVSSNSNVTLSKRMPFGQKHAVWVTRGGGTFDARPHYFSAARLIPSTNETFDVMKP